MPRDEYLRYWKCRKCHGTGRVIWAGRAERCFDCAGTGNAMVDGRAEDHKRRLREIDERHPHQEPNQ